MAKEHEAVLLARQGKYDKEVFASYVRDKADAPVKYGQLMAILETVAEEVGTVYKIAERKDGNALLEAQAIKRLEAHAAAVRDYTASFLYTRTSVEAGGVKELPAWLK